MKAKLEMIPTVKKQYLGAFYFKPFLINLSCLKQYTIYANYVAPWSSG